MIAFGIMLLMAGVIVLIAALAQYLQNRSYAASSEDATATVTGRRKRHVKNGVAYELRVSYTVDGNSYERTVGATATEYEQILEGQSLALKYKPHNPQKAVRPESLHPRNFRIALIIGLVLTAAGAILYLLGYFL